jgi:hypothetical protein
MGQAYSVSDFLQVVTEPFLFGHLHPKPTASARVRALRSFDLPVGISMNIGAAARLQIQNADHH